MTSLLTSLVTRAILRAEAVKVNKAGVTEKSEREVVLLLREQGYSFGRLARVWDTSPQNIIERLTRRVRPDPKFVDRLAALLAVSRSTLVDNAGRWRVRELDESI